MEKKHRDILRRNQVAFIKDLIVDEVFLAHMQSQNIVTDIFKEEIEVEKVATKRSSKFMNYLPRRGKNAFDVFYEALRATDQESLADLLYTDCSSSTKPVLKRALSHGGKTVCAPSEDIPIDDDDDDLPEEFPDPSFGLEFSIKHISEKNKQKLDNMKDVYPISRPGRCVIINNEKFAKPEFKRYGTNMDATVLDTLFRKFGYQVITHNDKTAEEIKEIAEEESGLVKDHGDSFIFIILSHGKKDCVLGVDLNEVKIKFIVDQFDGNNCPALLRKPKMFFLQACQGEKTDEGVAYDQGDTVDGRVDVSHKAAVLTDKQVDDIVEEVQATMDKLCLTQVTQPEEVSDASSVPTKADTLVAMSTVPDYVCWRSTSKGSWFIQAIVTVFSKCAHKDDLTSMMTKVNNLVSKAATGKNKFKQIPVTKNTLIRKVFFKPGMYDW